MADIILTDGDDIYTGTANDDFIYGRGGSDTIDGGAGSDRIYDGNGNPGQPDTDSNSDILRGGAGDDFLSGAGGSDRLEGGDGDDQIAGDWQNTPNPGNDTLLGGAGSDSLVGWAGNDILIGGTGADRMSGGTGNDRYYVDNIRDSVFEGKLGGEDSNGIDEVYSSISFVLSADAFHGDFENLRLVGSGNINATGNALSNRLVGNSGNNILDGRVGADRMSGGTGNDIYVLDNVRDVVAEAAGGGTDLVQSSVSWSMVANVEKVTLIGSANISAAGNTLKNTVLGNSGNNSLSGGAGNDAISAGNGNDRLYGGSGNDAMRGGGGSDAFVFNTALSSSMNKDTILDFSVTADTISLDNATFTAVGADGGLSSGAFRIGTAAADASDRVIYNSSTGALIYDSNGSASGGAVQFATLATGLALTSADFFII